MCSIPQGTAAPPALGGTACERADRALANLAAYQTAHVTMAAAAEMTVDLVADHVFTPAEALQALTEHVDRYRSQLARIDHEVRA
jgi:hypothetical protein